MQRQGEEKTLLHRFAENLDWLLMLSFAFLLATGIMAIYSATLHYGNPGKFFATQLAAVAIGIAGLVFFTSLNYQIFRPPTYIIYGFSSAILMSVLLFGSTVRGTKGWFNLGYFSFQPVEIAKLLFILALAGYLDKHWRDIRRWTKLVAPLALLLGQVGLILMQPDFSSTLVYFPVTLILLYVIGAESLYLLALIFFGAIAVGIPLLATFFKLQPALLTAHPVLKYLVAATHGGLPAVLILAGIVAALFILWGVLRPMRIHLAFVKFAGGAGINVGG